MRFETIVLSALAVCATPAGALNEKAKFLRSKMIQSKLLEKATPVSDHEARRLEQGNNQGGDQAEGEQDAQDEQWEQNLNLENTAASYDLQFKFCLNLPAYSEEAQNEDDDKNLTSYFESGTLGTASSYVLFDVCENNYFGNPFSGNDFVGRNSGSDSSSCDGGTYMVDLATYMGIITTEFMTADGQDYDDAYCTACADTYNYCQ